MVLIADLSGAEASKSIVMRAICAVDPIGRGAVDDAN